MALRAATRRRLTLSQWYSLPKAERMALMAYDWQVDQERERLIEQIRDDEWNSEIGTLAQIILMRFE